LLEKEGNDDNLEQLALSDKKQKFPINIYMSNYGKIRDNSYSKVRVYNGTFVKTFVLKELKDTANIAVNPFQEKIKGKIIFYNYKKSSKSQNRLNTKKTLPTIENMTLRQPSNILSQSKNLTTVVNNNDIHITTFCNDNIQGTIDNNDITLSINREAKNFNLYAKNMKTVTINKKKSKDKNVRYMSKTSNSIDLKSYFKNNELYY